MCKSVTETGLDGSAGKIKKKNFKTRRRTNHSADAMFFKITFLCIITFFNCLNVVVCNENDVLTLQDGLETKLEENDLPSDRRRPSNDQEKDILLLGALGRRKGAYHNSYGTSQEDDSIMDLLGKSEYFRNSFYYKYFEDLLTKFVWYLSNKYFKV